MQNLKVIYTFFRWQTWSHEFPSSTYPGENGDSLQPAYLIWLPIIENPQAQLFEGIHKILESKFGPQIAQIFII